MRFQIEKRSHILEWRDTVDPKKSTGSNYVRAMGTSTDYADK